MLIMLVIGARPNFMKVAPVYRALEHRSTATSRLLVHTGQHYDDRMSHVFFDELGMPKPDVFLGVGSGSHGEQTAKAFAGSSRSSSRPSRHGGRRRRRQLDVAAALAAVKLHVPVTHIEAGLRSFDPAMPEEHNRRLTDASRASCSRTRPRRSRIWRAKGSTLIACTSSGTR